jgi:hypothetical protein
MGALGQALPLAKPPPVPGQALLAAFSLGNFGVPPLGQPPAMGGVDLGAGAVGPLPNLLDMGALGVILSKLSVDNSLLFKAKRERDISVQIGLYSNPMSKRAIEHNMRLGM